MLSAGLQTGDDLPGHQTRLPGGRRGEGGALPLAEHPHRWWFTAPSNHHATSPSRPAPAQPSGGGGSTDQARRPPANLAECPTHLVPTSHPGDATAALSPPGHLLLPDTSIVIEIVATFCENIPILRKFDLFDPL